MGLIAEIQSLTAETTTYAEALERAYAAAVQQSQAMNELEQNARAAASAMVDAANTAATAATQMQAASGGGGGFDSKGNYNPNGNPLWGGKTLEQMLGWDVSSQISQMEAQNRALIKDTMDSLEKGTHGVGEAIEWLTNVMNENQKRIQENLQESEADRQLRDVQQRIAANKAAGVRGDSNDFNLLSNLEKVVAESNRAEQTNVEFDKQLKEVIAALSEKKIADEASAADWRDAITEFSDKVITDEIKGQTRVDEMSLEKLAKSMMEGLMKGAPSKTYEIKLGGSSIRTIDDPTDLIALIEELARSKKRSI